MPLQFLPEDPSLNALRFKKFLEKKTVKKKKCLGCRKARNNDEDVELVSDSGKFVIMINF